ncbi:transglycosylase SLT domain-containing protein [Idiomarina seosinensis]|uniref:transglycosylase SLT domain-containing protein n=1 Tax=Idiomarina seosinensis TaxID=281739 RepID=UPI00384BE138
MKKQSFIMRYKYKVRTGLIAVIVSLAAPFVVAAQPLSDQRAEQRELFLKAEYAAKRGRLAEYRLLREELEDYPLAPYLELERLQQIGYLVNEDRVLSFLQQYEGTPLDWQLRRKWLTYLAGHGEQERFIRDFRYPGTLTHQCHLIEAERAQGLENQAFIQKVDGIWAHGFSVPSACDGILAEWAELGARTSEKVWQRIGLAADGGNPTMIPYLKSLLPDNYQYLAELYHKVRYSPAAIYSDKRWQGADRQKEAEIATYALKKLIWRDENLALKAFEKLSQKLPFSSEQRQQVASEFAVALSLKKHPEARIWHQRVPPSSLDERTLQWRLATYLRDRDFSTLKLAIESLPPAIANGAQWRYWLARSSEITGDKLAANELYQELAKERNFYGFLSAARIGQAVSLDTDPIEMSPVELEQVKQHPSALRAYEFIQLERFVDARREWNHLLSELNGEQHKAAALLASEWEWHDQAIWTLAQIGYFDAVNIRFPMAYGSLLTGASNRVGIDPSWAMAVTRRESAFRADAYSSAGARGLMQILPNTAKRLRNDNISYRQLHKPKTNVELGTYYLSRLKNRFNDNHVLATASYNAGYYKVLDWLPSTATPADEWIEQVPYYETRDYLKAVLTYQQIYYLLQGNQGNLFENLEGMMIQPSYD